MKYIKFNLKNYYGRYLESAIVPGWGTLNRDAPGPGSGSGSVYRYGRGGFRKELPAVKSLAAVNNGYIRTTIDRYHDGSTVLVGTNQPQEDTNSQGYFVKSTAPDYGPFSLGTDTFSVVAIHKPIGDGDPSSNSSSDPRLYSKDIGFNEEDHDLLLGYITGTYTYGRARIRFGNSTRSLTFGNNEWAQVKNDKWNLIATTVKHNPASNTNYWFLYHIGEDNDSILSTFNNTYTGTYNPRNTTAEGLFNTVGDITEEGNLYRGSILCVYFFANISFTPTDIWNLWKNPWQVFEPRKMFFHEHKYDPTATIEAPLAGETLTITLVDAAGTTLPNLTGLSWAWFDQNTPDTVVAPVNQGTGETTDGSGIFSVELTNTTLTSGQTGALALMDSTGQIYAWYRITL